MVLSIPANAKKVWDSWNIRGFIVASLFVQAFLILCAPLRKRRWGKWGKCIDMLIWSAYLLADWVAGVAIGFILSNQMKSYAEASDIQVFWAPFLLLHLGGPDTITSYSLEDNEFWVRHLLGLALQVGSTLYVFIISLPRNMLWLPTLLVLIAGIIKYAERNRALYLASFDHLGDNWVSSEWEDGIPIPVQFKNIDSQATFKFNERSIVWSAVHHFGSIKRILVGPLLSLDQCSDIRETFCQENSNDALRIMEIEMSLLYEVLHTKLPVLDCKYGYMFRVISLGCILGALLSFSFFKKHYMLGWFDVLLTYGLLVGGLALDVLSIILQLFQSDWIFIHLFQTKESKFTNRDPFQTKKSEFINRSPFQSKESKPTNRDLSQTKESMFISKRRWSKVVSQLNFIAYHIKDHPSWLKKFADFLQTRSLLKAIRGIRCLSFQKLDDKIWHFISMEVKQLNEDLIGKLKDSSKTVLEAKEVWLYSRERVLKNFEISEQLTLIIKELDYTASILTWHIAIELCFQDQEATLRSNNPESKKSREMCKLLSDYMFYLAVMQPAMVAAVSINWKKVFGDTLEHTEILVPRNSISNENDARRKILQLSVDATEPEEEVKNSVLCAASKLASQLKRPDSYPWDSMSKVCVQLMCFAAINCRPNVHAQQPSKGGELLTFIWLFMNHLGLGTHFSTHY